MNPFKNKVVRLFLFDQMPDGSTSKLVFKTRVLKMEKTNDRSTTLSAFPLEIS